MVHEKHWIVRGPFRSSDALWRSCAFGTLASHVTTQIRQPQTPDGKSDGRLTSDDEMGARVNALYGGVRMGQGVGDGTSNPRLSIQRTRGIRRNHSLVHRIHVVLIMRPTGDGGAAGSPANGGRRSGLESG
jgi:hypothetical protein